MWVCALSVCMFFFQIVNDWVHIGALSVCIMHSYTHAYICCISMLLKVYKPSFGWFVCADICSLGTLADSIHPFTIIITTASSVILEWRAYLIECMAQRVHTRKIIGKKRKRNKRSLNKSKPFFFSTHKHSHIFFSWVACYRACTQSYEHIYI